MPCVSAREMGSGGLMYAGGYPLYENFRDLSLPGDFHSLFESAPGRYMFEVHSVIPGRAPLTPCQSMPTMLSLISMKEPPWPS